MSNTSTTKQVRTWRRLFPAWATHGVFRGMCAVEVRIVRDPDWGEYRCELWVDGVHRTNATYYADDTNDALLTGAAMLSDAVRQWLRDDTHARSAMSNATNVG